MKGKYLILWFSFFAVEGFAQIDTVTKSLQQIVVTATRTSKSIGDVPLPITVITQKQIQNLGFQKLTDVLQTQAGLQLSNNILGQSLQGYPNPFGNGIQLQGLDAGYTLILLDGMPMTGRNAGVLNLDRINVNNIKQIEIIKGPAASLYGADALAGVINIITKSNVSNTLNAQLHYGTNNTIGVNVSASLQSKKNNTQFFLSRFSSSGYDLDETIFGKTIDPSQNYTATIKNEYKISNSLILKNQLRYFTQKQFNNYLVDVNQQTQQVKGTSLEKDWGIQNELVRTINALSKLNARVYLTGYNNDAKVFLQKDNSLFDNSFLKQFFLKGELVYERTKNKATFLAGAGADYETINSSRYANKKELGNLYAFAQQEFIFKKMNIVAGLRLDKHRLFTAQLNPRVAASYKINSKLNINASIGRGFKAPDFRQQFLFFTNSIIGYTLLGVNELGSGLQQLKQQGQIDNSININPYLNIPNLLPETSLGFNAELKWSFLNNAKLTVGFFRNDINNLIERYNLPFTKTNGQAIFSYQNINKVFTQGATVSLQVNVNKKIAVNVGYQYLDAKDKDVLTQINNKQIVKRDPITFESRYTTKKEYGGLFNRSKHTATAQVTFTLPSQFTLNTRVIYNGKSGYADVNGNAILDDEREYTNEYFLAGLTLSKKINNAIQLQAGADNLLAHTDKLRLPHLSGRTYFITAIFNLEKIFKHSQIQ
ncbi:MAG: TonB-dependent receptor [Ferruginibacter sp.]|nr:TonB-dependent receptor [Ferruginibacter sp.]